MADVRLSGVSKHFAGGAVAVDDISLAIPHGQFLVLVGPSGCGKTTVLRLVAGLERASAGRVLIGDRDVTHLPPAERDVAMVFQSYALYPHLSVRDNIAFGLRVRAVPHGLIAERVRRAAELLAIEELLDRRPAQLSGGQRQRVALARAIVREPKVFLFDEPLSNLDAAVRAQTRAELVALHRRLGATMLYVTHDQVEAMTMAERVAVMSRGRIEQAAPPLALYQRPETLFVASFIGSPPINRLPGRVTATPDGCRFVGAVRVPVAAAPMPRAILGVRPEHLIVGSAGAGVPAVVALVEPLGPESHVHLRLADGGAVIARVPGAALLAPGAAVGLRVAAEHALLFDEAGRLAGPGVAGRG